MSTNAESQLIERCQRGDDEAFRELIEQHKRLVFALMARSIRDQGRAEELAQEVFLRVYRGLRHFRGEARLATWIYRIASNVLAEERRPGRPIEISVHGEPAHARLVVRDHGVGIPADEQDKVFGPFARATTARYHPGLGLGLWIVQQIVQASPGRITLDSRVEEGSTFTVELPR